MGLKNMIKLSVRTILFSPASLLTPPPLMSMYHAGIGCSLSAAKVVSGFYGQTRASGRPLATFHSSGSILALNLVALAS